MFDSNLIDEFRVPHLARIDLWGEHADPVFIRSVLEKLPTAEVGVGYDSTEALATSLVNYPNDQFSGENSCVYQVNPALEFEFVVDHLNLESEYCRLKVTGANVMMGYWNDLCAQLLPDLDPPHNSYLFEDWIEPVTDTQFKVMGRVDSIVKVLGRKVSLTAVESVVRSHPAVREAYVVAINNSRGIVKLVAAVCLGSETQKSSLVTHCRQNLPAEAVPSRIEIFPEFKRLQSGKLDRKSIKEHLLKSVGD